MKLRFSAILAITATIFICPTSLYAYEKEVNVTTESFENSTAIPKEISMERQSSTLEKKDALKEKAQNDKSRSHHLEGIPDGTKLVYKGRVTRGNWTMDDYAYVRHEGTSTSYKYLTKLISYNDKTNETNIRIPTFVNGLYRTILDTSEQGLKNIFADVKVKSITIEDGLDKLKPAYVDSNNCLRYLSTVSFNNWRYIKSIDLHRLDTSSITNLRYAFKDCVQLNNVNLSGWDVSRVSDFTGLFQGDTNLSSVNLSNWNMSNTKNLRYMFWHCNNLKTLDLRTVRLNEASDITEAFTTTNNVETVIASDSHLLNNTDFTSKYNRIPLKKPLLDANGGSFSDGSKTKSYFEKCVITSDRMEIANFEKFKQGNIPSKQGFGGTFLGWQQIGGNTNPNSLFGLIDATFVARWGNPNWEFEEDNTKILLTRYIGNSNEVVVPSNHNGKKIVLKDINTTTIPTRVNKFSVEQSEQYKVGIEDNNLNFAFDGNSNLQEVDFRGLDTSNITNMEVMFRNCTNLKKVNFSDIDMSKVVAMGYNFQNCRNLTEANFNNVDVSSLRDTQYMFSGCDNLKVLDLRSFQLPSNANCSKMFYTNAQTELLVLTNDEKIKGLNYQNNHRIPLDGVKLSGNGGIFSNNQSIKKYFEKCVYSPEKIKISEFEKFKQENRPTRTEFATTFVSWEPEKGEPQNPTNVLDLGNMTYKATWSDPNWDFTETEDEITLTRYKGTSNEINLSAVLDNKQVTLKDINNNVIPTTITKFILKEKNRKKVKVKDTNLSQGFLNNTNLTEVNLSGLDSSLVTNLQELFKNCSNLLRVTLTGMNTQNVSNFKSMFYECSKLSNVNVTNLNTANVTDMSHLFYNCYALKDINLAGWNTTNVQWMGKMFHNTSITSLDISHFSTPVLKSTNRMFNGCNNLKIVRMDNFDMSHNTDSAAMFYRGQRTETLVVTKDNQLLINYSFKGDNTHPLSKPVLNANGGKFDDQETTKKYFVNCAVTPEKLQQAQFDQFKNSNRPTKDNAVFRGWTESGTSKTDEGVLNLLDKTYTAIWKNTICNTSPDNKKIESTGSLGIVYLPQQFATNSTTLKDNGKQDIPINKDNSFNIGIRDITQSRDSWNITGQLRWNSSIIPGAYIQLDANDNSIKINQNDNVSPYDSTRDLTSANEEVKLGNVEGEHLKITSDSANIVMKANPEKKKDAIYDYNLGEVSLVIPDAGVVKDGEYSANLEWNLINAPQ